MNIIPYNRVLGSLGREEDGPNEDQEGACQLFTDRDTGVVSLGDEVLNSPMKPTQVSSCDSVLKHFVLP